MKNFRATGPNSGCQHAPRCLECPFDDCIEGASGTGRKKWADERQREIVRLHAEGWTYPRIAEAHPEYGLTASGVRSICQQGQAGKE